MKAVWNNTLIAESDDTVEVEGNHYFPHSTIASEHFLPSDTHTSCPWKGEASYYNVLVDGKLNPDAAWFYPNPKQEALAIKNRVAFWKGVDVRE